jgi:hypothetical protein
MAKPAASFRNLLTKLGLEADAPADPAEIARFENRNKRKVPKELAEVLAISNGRVFRENNLRMLTLEESQEWLTVWDDGELPRDWGYVPFAEDYESNVFAVCANSPLKGMVVRVLHDDDAQLHSRSLTSWFGWVASFETDDDWAMLEKPTEFAKPARTKKDLTIAGKLQELEESDSEIAVADKARFLLTLLGEGGIAMCREMMASDNIYVRESAELLLRKIDNETSRQLLDEYRRMETEFADRCIRHLAAAEPKITATFQGPGAWSNLDLRLNNKRVGLSFFELFKRRNEPTALDRVLDLARIHLRIPGELSDVGIQVLAGILDLGGGDAESAKKRLRGIDTPFAREANRSYDAATRQFAEECIRHLAENGIVAEFSEGDDKRPFPALRIRHGEKTSDFPFNDLYCGRKDDYTWTQLLQRANQYLTSLKGKGS